MDNSSGVVWAWSSLAYLKSQSRARKSGTNQMSLSTPGNKLALASREATMPYFNIVYFSEYEVKIKWFALSR